MRPLTQKQELFSIAMFTIGSEFFGNGTASARKAGYKGSEDVLATVAKENIRKPQIIARKHVIQAKVAKIVQYNNAIALDMLTSDYARLAKKAAAGDIQAIQARTAISRELNACTGQHVINVNSQNKTLSITVAKKEV